MVDHLVQTLEDTALPVKLSNIENIQFDFGQISLNLGNITRDVIVSLTSLLKVHPIPVDMEGIEDELEIELGKLEFGLDRISRDGIAKLVSHFKVHPLPVSIVNGSISLDESVDIKIGKELTKFLAYNSTIQTQLVTLMHRLHPEKEGDVRVLTPEQQPPKKVEIDPTTGLPIGATGPGTPMYDLLTNTIAVTLGNIDENIAQFVTQGGGNIVIPGANTKTGFK